MALSQSYFGEGLGQILLDEVSCTGSEERLIDCRALPLGVHDCIPSGDAGVTCLQGNNNCDRECLFRE